MSDTDRVPVRVTIGDSDDDHAATRPLWDAVWRYVPEPELAPVVEALDALAAENAKLRSDLARWQRVHSAEANRHHQTGARLDRVTAENAALRAQVEADRLQGNDAARMIDDLEAQRDMLRAYIAYIEPYAVRGSVLPGDDEDDAIQQARAEHGVAALMREGE